MATTRYLNGEGDEGRTTRDFVPFFEEEYRRLARAMYLLAGDQDEADDLAQEAFLRLYERWGRVAVMASPVGYLYRTALNLHRSRLRRLARFPLKSLGGSPPSSSTALEGVEDRDELGRALAAIPRKQREALVLCGWLGLDAAEAAERVGATPAAMKMRLSRGKALLRERLRRLDGELSGGHHG